MKINIFASDSEERRAATTRHAIALVVAVAINLLFWTVRLPVGSKSLSFGELVISILENVILMEASFFASRLVIRAFMRRRCSFMSLVAQNIIILMVVVLVSMALAHIDILLYPEYKWLSLELLLCDVLVAYFLSSLFMTSFLTEKCRKEQVIAQQATIDKLKLQTDNHFVFNSLATLGHLIETDARAAASFNASTSRMYKYIISKGGAAVVTLSEELAFIEEYRNNLSLRHANIEIEVDEELSGLDSFMPPLTLQGLVVNAIKHNRHGAGHRLLIRLEADKELGYITVTNNRVPMERIMESSGIGLDTLDERYKYICGRGIIRVQDDHEFKVCLPIIRQNDIRI